jgi:hypothetical protein
MIFCLLKFGLYLVVLHLFEKSPYDRKNAPSSCPDSNALHFEQHSPKSETI